MTKSFLLAIALAVLAITSVADADADDKLFQDKCAMCHGADGKAHSVMGKQLNIKDWSDGKTLNVMSDADIGKEIQFGKALMPKFPLAADQIKALVAYVRTLQR